MVGVVTAVTSLRIGAGLREASTPSSFPLKSEQADKIKTKII